MQDTDNPVEELEPETDDLEAQDIEDTEESDTEPAETDEEDQEAETDEEDDSEEVEYEGEKYRVPRNLKDALLRQSDYTKKTQEIAEQRKELEGALERVDKASREETQALAKVAGIDTQIAQIEQYDLDAWAQQDPQGAQNARLRLIELRQMRGDAVSEYDNAREQTRSVAQQEAARRAEEGKKVLAQKIPGWGKDKADAILAFGQEAYGASREQLEAIEDPWMVIALHDAMEGRKLSKQAATRKTIEAKQAIKPAAKVQGKGAVGHKGLSDKLSAEEWVRRRNAQVAKQT